MEIDADPPSPSERESAAEAQESSPEFNPDDSAIPADEAEADNPSAQAGSQFPDASSLVAMAAMHLPTSDLLRVLVSVFDSKAWQSMGLVADHTGEVVTDLPQAQLAIDCVVFLLGKVESSLGEAERRDIQRRVMDLRMNYVAKTREGGS